jgi:hypothetical protein
VEGNRVRWKAYLEYKEQWELWWAEKAKRMRKERNMRTDRWRGQGNKNGGVERIEEGNKLWREDMKVEVCDREGGRMKRNIWEWRVDRIG